MKGESSEEEELLMNQTLNRSADKRRCEESSAEMNTTALKSPLEHELDILLGEKSIQFFNRFFTLAERYDHNDLKRIQSLSNKLESHI